MKRNLVIIPGWNGTMESWKKFVELAGENFEVFFLEMPCFGSVPCPKIVWGVEEYADYVKDKIRGLDEPVLLGHSFGGQLAVNLAANNPDLFSDLILSGAAVLRPKNSLKRFLFTLIAKAGKIIFSLPLLNRLENLAKKFLYKAADSPDYGETQEIKREIFKKVIRQSQAHLLSEIKTRTLVVWGEKDSYVPLREGKKIVELIPDAKLKIIPGGKHGLHIQQPEVLLEVINEFVS